MRSWYTTIVWLADCAFDHGTSVFKAKVERLTSLVSFYRVSLRGLMNNLARLTLHAQGQGPV